MKAMMTNDRCFCTVNNGSNPFNTDGASRETLTYEEGRTALDFDIVKTPVYLQDGRKCEGLYTLTKDTDGSFVPNRGVGDKFEPIQHRDVFDYIVNEVAPQYPEMKLETCGTIYGGSTGLMTFRVGDLFNVKGDKSPCEMRLFVSNPCNGVGSLVMGFTSVRLFCRNQLAAARREAGRDGFRVRHTKNGVTFLGDAVKAVGEQIAAAKEIRYRMDLLASVGATREQLERCIDRIYPFGTLEEGTAGYTRMLNLRNEVIEQFEGGKTAQEMDGKTGWTLFNSFTEPLFNPTHIRSSTDLADIEYRGMGFNIADKVRKMLDVVTDEVAAA